MDAIQVLNDEAARLRFNYEWERANADVTRHEGRPKYLSERSLRWRLGAFVSRRAPRRVKCLLGSHVADLWWRFGTTCTACHRELPRSPLGALSASAQNH